eukprot:6191296-Pleurochrysis_carterae.AAC.1
MSSERPVDSRPATPLITRANSRQCRRGDQGNAAAAGGLRALARQQALGYIASLRSRNHPRAVHVQSSYVMSYFQLAGNNFLEYPRYTYSNLLTANAGEHEIPGRMNSPVPKPGTRYLARNVQAECGRTGRGSCVSSNPVWQHADGASSMLEGARLLVLARRIYNKFRP